MKLELIEARIFFKIWMCISVSGASAACFTEMEGDLYCDRMCMTTSHSYDTGSQPFSDCAGVCDLHCADSLLKNGVCDGDCNTWDCQWDNGDCLSCASECLVTKLEDGICDEACNVGECGWDGGDCSSQEFPTRMYVGTGEEGNGSMLSPFSDVSRVLWELGVPYADIFLLEGNHLLKSETLPSAVLFAQRSLVSTTIRGSTSQWPTVRLTRSFTALNIAHKVTFSNIYFEGSFDLQKDCWEPTCLYCPFTAFHADTRQWTNDRGEIIDVSKYASQSSCNEYHDKVFISVFSSASVLLENVTFAHFNQQLRALLLNECGSVHLRNVTFEKCMAAPSGLAGGLVQHTCPSSNAPYDCGEIVFEGGSVMYLNDGYEYRSDIVFSGFMFIGGIRLLNLTNITFSYNNIMIGDATVRESELGSALLSLTNFRQLEISFCHFFSNLAFTSSALYITSYLHFPLLIHDGTASEQLLPHLRITDSVFDNNTAIGGSVLSLYYRADHQNILFEKLTFRYNSCLHTVVLIENEKAEESDWIGANKIISGEEVFIPPKVIELSSIFAVSNYAEKIISVTNAGNAVVINSYFYGNGELPSSLTSFFPAFTLLLTNTETYMSIPPAISNTIVCSEVVALISVQNSTFENNTLEHNLCPQGISGLFISGYGDFISLHHAIFLNNLGIALRLFTVAPVFLHHLRFENNTNNANRHAACLDFHLLAPSDMVLTDSIFRNNTAWFSSAAYFDNVRSLLISRVSITISFAIYCCSGLFFNPSPTGPSSFHLSDSEFEGNKAGSFSPVTIMDDNSVLVGNHKAVVDFLLENCSFTDNSSGSDGGAVSIGTFITLSQQSVVRNCSFVRNVSGNGGGLTAQFQSGVLTVAFSTFERNQSPRGAAIFLGHGATLATTSVVYLTSCYFEGQMGGPAVMIQGQSVDSEVFAANNVFEGGDGAMEVASASLFDQSSVYSKQEAAEGAVVFAQTHAKLTFTGMLAVENLATSRGGVFFISSHSSLLVSGSHILNNSAVASGGAIFMDEDSSAELISSEFRGNAAKIASVLYASPADVRIVNNTFAFNTVTNYATVFLSHCTTFISFSRFSNNTSVSDSPGLFFSSCIVEIADSTMRDQNGKSGGFIQSIDHNLVTIIRTSFERGTATSLGGAIFATLESNLTIVSSSFSDCRSQHEGGAISLQASYLTLRNSSFLRTYTTNSGGAISTREGKMVLEGSRFELTGPGAVYASGMERLTVERCVFERGIAGNGGAMIVKNVLMLRVEGNVFSGNAAGMAGGGVWLTSDGTQSVPDKHFFVGNEFRLNKAGTSGGGLFVADVDLHLTNNSFIGNEALAKGGAVQITCTIWKRCNITIAQNEFSSNRAEVQGGGVDWSGAYPHFEGNVFENNSASYGGDISSFPVMIALLSSASAPAPYLYTYESLPVALKLTDVASGQLYPGRLTFGMFDHRNILLTTDIHGGAELVPLNGSSLLVTGYTGTEAVKGLIEFQGFLMVGEPGTTQYLKVVCDGVHVELHDRVGDEAEYYDVILLEVQFRPCKSGESKQRSLCFLCNSGTYSLDPTLPCLLCPSQAICYGNDTMVPKPGYWRISNTTDNFIECLAPEACIGSPDPPFLSQTGLCATGYLGNLCQQCIDNYSRTGRFLCGKCPNRAANAALTSLIVIVALLIVAIVVFMAIKSAMRPQSLIAIYVKIFMNYLQMVVVSASLNLNWPSFTKTFLNGQQMVGGMADQLFSFDCLLQDASITGKSLSFTKVQIYSLMPPGFLLLSLLIWGLISLCTQLQNITRKFLATCVIIVFILHPSITKTMFSMFACMDLGDGQLWLINDLSIVCWNSEHVKQILMVVVPTLAISVFGLPMLTLLVLVRKRAVLESPSIKLMLCFLYKGYNRPRFYWEFVILYRKVAMIAASVFLAPVSIRLQALTVLALLLFALFLQVQIKPFFESSLNLLEVRAILVSALTIYSGLYYDAEELGVWLKICLFCVILVANAYFLITWLRIISPVLIQTLKEKFAYFTTRKKTYRIQAMNSTGLRTLHDRPSLPDVSSDFSNPQCSGIDPSGVLDPSVYAEPPNTSVVMPREYTNPEESKDPQQYTFVE